jgi:hypothetical protein
MFNRRRWFNALFLPRFALSMVALVAASGQTAPIHVAGVELRLGMSKESVFAVFKPESKFQVAEIGADWYAISVKTLDLWASAGSLTFHGGRLVRIARNAYSSDKTDTASFAKELYTAIAAGEKLGVVTVWTGRNEDASSPLYAVHLVFKDREVVMQTVATHIESLGNIQVSDIKVYFPRERTSERSK